MARQQAGSVSIFSVIFASLLLTVVTVSFIKLMVTDQQQATTNDLSQSAYDAALAGVEDAKRVIRACQKGKSTACDALAKPHDCKVVYRSQAVANSSPEETRVVSNSSNGQRYDQAYTCINITMDTSDYLYKSVVDRSQIVLLRSKQEFDTIQIEWFSRDDTAMSQATNPTTDGNTSSLPPKANLHIGAPPLLRAQIITPGTSFRLDELDATGRSVTAFLRPYIVTASTLTTELDLSHQARATSDGEYDNSVSPVACHADFPHQGYACHAKLKVQPVSAANSKHALLRLTPLYRGGSVRVSLHKGGVPVTLDGVQPSVDATGRAANVFRRVDARLQIGSDFPYPEYAVEVMKSLCKDFSVTDSQAIPGSCQF